MDEFLVLLQAKLDEAKSKGNVNADIKELQNQLDKLKVQVELDPKATQKLADSIGKLVNQKIVISNIGINQNNLSKTGQQIEQVISDSAEKAIGNVTSKNIGKYFRVSQSDSRQFQAEMKKLVSGWTNGKGKVTDINIQTRTSFDKDVGENIERLHQATVTYKNELDEVIKKTIAWRQIGTTTNDKGEEKILRGFVEVAGQYSKAIDAASVKTDNFVKKQKETVANMQNTLNQISSRAFDKNSSRPITSDSSLEQLNTQVAHVESAMNDLRNATSGTFDDAKIKVQEEISALKILEKQLRNADNVSTKMKGTDITSGLSIAKNDLEKFKADAKDFPQMIKIMEDLDTAISKVGDASSLNAFNDQLRVARSELAKIKSETSSVNRNEKVGINVSGLQSQIADLQRISPEIDKFETEINGVKVTVESLLTDLSKVNTQSDFSVINSKWKAFTNSAKSAGIAITEVATKSDSLKNRINKIQLSIDNGYGASEYQNRINAVTASLEKYGVETQEAKNITASLQSTFDSMKGMSGQDLVNQADKLEQEFKAVKASVEQAKIAYDKYMQPVSNEKATSLINRINTFLSKNTRITNDAKIALQGYADELGRGVSLSRWNEINGKLKETENSMRGLHRLGASLKDQMSQAAQSFTQWLSVSSVVMLLVSKIKNAITELKEVNSIMTEISKTADQLSKADLSKVENTSYKTASKYGKKASNYLTGIQEMYRAGYENAEDLAELSTLAQAAGDMQADLANDYLIATDAAYKLKGNTEALNDVLDGQNYITNRNALSMQDLAEATKIAASQSASSGIAIDQATAAMGTMIATTRQGGDVAARAWKGILMNIQQVEGEVEDGEIIDAESLSKYEKACESLGVSLKEVKDGVISLRDPMQILKELSEAYTALDESDARRANLISAVGGKYRGNQLNALLENWSLYEKMLKDYAEGSGSALEEAMKSANNWEGSMNRLGNTFTKVVNNIIKSDAVIAGANGLNSLLSVIDKITSKLGSLGTIGLGAGLFTSIKNVGMAELY